MTSPPVPPPAAAGAPFVPMGFSRGGSMVFDEVEVSIAANATNTNVFEGRRFSRAPMMGRVTLYSTGSATGLTEEFNVGGSSVSPAVPVNANNRSPIVPNDLRVTDIEVNEGELLQVTVANTTAGALTYRARLEFAPGFMEEVGVNF